MISFFFVATNNYIYASTLNPLIFKGFFIQLNFFIIFYYNYLLYSNKFLYICKNI